MDKKQNKARFSSELVISFSIALFLIGGELLDVGLGNAVEAYSSGIAFIIACLALSAAAPAARAVFGAAHISEIKSILRRITFIVFGILVVAAALFVALDTAKDFSDFAAKVMFLRAPASPIGILFLLFSAFLASRGEKTVKKFAMISLIAVLLSAVLLILLSLPTLDLRNLSFDADATPNPNEVADIFVSKFASICVALVYFGHECDAKKGSHLTSRAALIGVLLGGAILTVCYANVTLLLGGALANSEEFPYSVAVSAVSAGKLFMRMEGFSYVMYFLSMSVRAAICIGTIISILKCILPRLKKQS